MSTKKEKVCDAVVFLSRYQDNELDLVTREKIDTHLQECEVCQKELMQLRDVIKRIKQLPEVETDPAFNARVLGKMMDKENKHRWTWLPSSDSLAKVIYSIVFIIFLVLGIWLNMTTVSIIPNATNDPNLDLQQEQQMVLLLVESQDLGLINVQDKTIAMLYNANGEAHAK
jgi:hypothetical protein